jgi:Arc/MetJ family transcription regulator
MHLELEIDEELVSQAMQIAQSATAAETIETALRELISSHKRPDLRDLFGSGGIDPGYDYKAMRTGDAV